MTGSASKRFFALIFWLWLSCDYVSFLVSFWTLRCPKMTFLLQKNSYFHGSACFIKVVGIITDFMDFYRFLVPVLAYICLLLGSSFVHWILTIFWCQNGSQNGPQNGPQNRAKRAQSQTPFWDPPGVHFGVVFGRFLGSFWDPFGIVFWSILR